MKYVNQLKYPHWLYVTRTEMEEEQKEIGRTTTVKTSACGLCAAVMVAHRLLPNCAFDLAEAIELSYAINANRLRGTRYKLYAPAFAEKLGLKYKASGDLDELRHCLRTGGAAVAIAGGDRCGHVGLFTHGGHFITIINEEPDGRFAILDPSYQEGKYEEEGRRGKVEVKNGCITLCTPETLLEECPMGKGDQAFFLFWRG